jgi:hypothetical protein
VCGGQASPHKPRLVVSHSTCPPLSSSPHAHSFVLGTAVINNNSLHPDSAGCSEHVIQKEGRGARGSAGEDARASRQRVQQAAADAAKKLADAAADAAKNLADATKERRRQRQRPRRQQHCQRPKKHRSA